MRRIRLKQSYAKSLHPETKKASASRLAEMRRHLIPTNHLYTTYRTNRDFAVLKAWPPHFDLEKYLRARSPKGKFSILDSGAGLKRLATDIKTKFGKRAFVAALIPLPLVAPKNESRFRRVVARVSTRYATPRKGESLETMRKRSDEHAESVLDAEKRSQIIDEEIIGMAEDIPDNYKRRYDFILDMYAPLAFSEVPERVLERYGRVLKNNGKIITPIDGRGGDQIVRRIQTQFCEGSPFAKEHGYYFTIQLIPEAFKAKVFGAEKYPMYEIIKTPNKA